LSGIFFFGLSLSHPLGLFSFFQKCVHFELLKGKWLLTFLGIRMAGLQPALVDRFVKFLSWQSGTIGLIGTSFAFPRHVANNETSWSTKEGKSHIFTDAVFNETQL
jgi:hypothetical protein